MFVPELSKKQVEKMVGKEYDVSNMFNAAKGVIDGELCVIREKKFIPKIRINLSIMLAEFSLFLLSCAFMIFPRNKDVNPFLPNGELSPKIRKELIEASSKPLNWGVQKAGEIKLGLNPDPISVPNKVSTDTRARQVDTDMKDLMKGIVRK